MTTPIISEARGNYTKIIWKWKVEKRKWDMGNKKIMDRQKDKVSYIADDKLT